MLGIKDMFLASEEISTGLSQLYYFKFKLFTSDSQAHTKNMTK